MEILKYLDVLIGLAVVMVLLSPLVAGITQVILWGAGARAGRLQVALENLILLLNVPGEARLSAEDARGIARSVLVHPMIGKPLFLWFRVRPGDHVGREELMRILAELAGAAESDATQRLARLMKANDVAGRIATWFDPVMERTSGEYRFRAQLVTVLSAGLVASTVQMDSIDLLKRLSTDDKLRDSLVKQAQEQESRLEQQAAAEPGRQNADELELARARRDEIEASLAKLRDPQLGVLPDHFIWQPLPRARLMRNPDWKVPFSRRLELVVGANVYSLEPRWTADPLSDIEMAIRNSPAPVRLQRETRRQVVVRGPGIEKLPGAALRSGPAQAQVCLPVAPGQYFLIAGYHAPVPFQVELGSDFRAALDASPAAVSTAHWPVLTALDPDVRWIELRRRAEDPATNVLGPVVFPETVAEFDDAGFPGGRFEAEVKRLKAAGFRVSDAKAEYLVITSERLGPLQLRSVPGRPESNMLNATPEFSRGIDWDLLQRTWRGVVLTWVLLSLGAPFWYDALKDLLKLRSSLARKEESARNDTRLAA